MEISKYFRAPIVKRLPAAFYDVKCSRLATDLLGQVLCRRLPSGVVLKARIVETEAYPGEDDKGSYSYNGRRTEHNEPMYMKPGTTFIYMTYGMYHCMNISSRGDGAAVLLRALEPLEEVEQMHVLRNEFRKAPRTPPPLRDICRGPSRLCIAMDIDKVNVNKVDLADSDAIWIEEGTRVAPGDVVSGKRIGLGKAAGECAETPLRFYIRDCQFVSLVGKSRQAPQLKSSAKKRA